MRGRSLELASKDVGRIGTYGAENRNIQLYGKHTNCPESFTVKLNASTLYYLRLQQRGKLAQQHPASETIENGSQSGESLSLCH